MTIKIKRLFHGYASIRDYQAMEAFAKEEDLVIECHGDSMYIPWQEITGGMLGTTVFHSIHDNTSYRLIDYPWKPTVQQTLFPL